VNSDAGVLRIAIPEKLIPVFEGRADVRGAYGGRGSAKTRSFAKMAAAFGMRYGQAGIKGQILCARQYMNSLDDSSLEEVKRAIEEEPFLAAYYEVGEKYICSRDGNISFGFAGLHLSIDSIKSKGRILLCWVDEAEPVLESAWNTLEPTLREEADGWNAELWVTWNPKRKSAAVEKRYRNSSDPLIKIVELNWRDNPKFPGKLERQRERDLEGSPDEYPHIWDGAYQTVVKGAYYAQQIAAAKASGRVSRVAADPLLTFRVHCDIGGTGINSDAFVMWADQIVGREVRLLDYYEVQGQPAAAHVLWLREHGYVPGNTTIVLPHDGAQADKVFAITYQGAFQAAGYDTIVIPNMGKGAAKLRIEAGRRLFGAMWFDADGTEVGLDTLACYHEKIDEKRDIGLGPEHDSASHCGDSFGLIAVDYELNKPSGTRVGGNSDTYNAVAHWKRKLRQRNGTTGRGAMTA
jgi:phage terminase large subunit